MKYTDMELLELAKMLAEDIESLHDKGGFVKPSDLQRLRIRAKTFLRFSSESAK